MRAGLSLKTVVGGHDVYQGDGSIFHSVDDTVDLVNDVVIQDLKDNGNNETEYRGKEGYLNTTSYYCWRKITYRFDTVEGLDHTYYRTHEPKHGCNGDKESDPNETTLEEAHLNGTVRNNGLFYSVGAVTAVA
jgi:hypothetical protein